eukprot:TRINITY_DN3328_c0_g1_i1.p1 TRINITY_DN3328_c0_g1~~TRINITY_DN3328_c0_g1_i1.p1  ORF type:complete len:327 (-),score=38.61 TRINITY_DN3328_c0_g1_i1:75-1055(-)
MSRLVYIIVLFLLPLLCTSINWYNNKVASDLTTLPQSWNFSSPYNNSLLQLLFTFTPNEKTIFPASFLVRINTTIGFQQTLSLLWNTKENSSVFSFQLSALADVNQKDFWFTLTVIPAVDSKNSFSVYADVTFVDTLVPVSQWVSDNFYYYQPWDASKLKFRHYSFDLSEVTIPGDINNQAFNLTFEFDQVNLYQFDQLFIWNNIDPTVHAYDFPNIDDIKNYMPFKIQITDVGFALWYMELVATPTLSTQSLSPLMFKITPTPTYYGNCTLGWCVHLSPHYLAPTVPPKLGFSWWQVVVPVGGACIVGVVWFFTLTTKTHIDTVN